MAEFGANIRSRHAGGVRAGKRAKRNRDDRASMLEKLFGACLGPRKVVLRGCPGEARSAPVRIHDLRHTFASLLVPGGMTLPMFGKLLGHTQVQTTQRYAHLLDDPLRAGLEQVGTMLRAKPRLVPLASAIQ
jgi:integrase